MKRTCMMLVALALILGLAQCKKNTEQNINENEGEKVYITLNVNQGNGSRLDVDPPHVVFQNGDKIYVASNGVYVGYLEYNGTNFSGEISNAIEGQPLYFYLLGNVTPVETLTSGSTTSCSVVISDQTVNKPVIACNKSNENFGTTNTFTSTLRNKCALVKFNVTTSSTVATCITGFNNKVTVDFSNNTLTNSQENNGVITLPAGNGEKWAILLPQDAMESGTEGSAYSVNGVYTGTRGAVPTITNNGYLTEGIEVVISTVNVVHDYVDLGLQSGILWATCNVGADVPEDYGDYFAWGETQPKDHYTKGTYQYCMGSEFTLTKYCKYTSYGYNGFVDNLTVLLPEDDAATVNWGADWCTPTEEVWQDLYQNTTCTWTTQNGVYGRLFTASNGNNLFLPATGWQDQSGHGGAGIGGNYWSSSTDGSFLAWYFGFDSDLYGMANWGRDNGRCVRPIRSISQNISFFVGVTANPMRGGTVRGGGIYFNSANCTVSAIPNDGYVFINWTENGEVVSTEATFSFFVSGNRNLVANFAVDGGGHDYVDLGLSSGLLWATCNVGANTPEDYGAYFAWGETEPKDIYDWSTYQYCNGSYNTLTKYCYNSAYGYVDNLTTLQSDDDAATVNWGSGWRMPTEADWEELYQSTTVTWTTMNDVNGVLFTGWNGNSLFIPSAGYIYNGNNNYVGTDNCYWLSSLYTDYPYFASSSNDHEFRFCGLPVRPVHSTP